MQQNVGYVTRTTTLNIYWFVSNEIIRSFFKLRCIQLLNLFYCGEMSMAWMSSATVYMRPLFVISLNKALDYVNGFQNSMIHKFHVSIPEDNEYNKKVYISTKKNKKRYIFLYWQENLGRINNLLIKYWFKVRSTVFSTEKLMK